ncbi:MAG: hypothetical protein ACD_76C00077G0001 [uncultured bacterium]|nr:MAG: hypothetical protein ACD_76C00077G0001 [uncultured bacterium]HBD05306.1 phosphohydrolase [Candidatus Uhrbacteria bacterium]
MDNKKIILQIADEVKNKFDGDGTGHDWWHILRVWNTAKRICESEGGDIFIVELGALLHDIADWKFNNNDDTVGSKVAKEILERYSIPQDVIVKVCEIIDHVSFKGAGVKNEMESLEGKIVQDADRLDAIGAIGIARAFVYGGYKGQPMHIPDHAPITHRTKEEYFNSAGTAINHFYEKLLLLKNRMNTNTAKQMADERHKFMQEYLDRFYKEWDGKM